jgi:hypothetical protein
MRMRTADTFALEALKRSITSVAYTIKMREIYIKVVINELNCQGYFLLQVLCLIACWAEDPNGEAYKLHLGRIPDNYWVAEDGLKIQVLYIYMITPCLFQLLVCRNI